jgi:hypothetical protein
MGSRQALLGSVLAVVAAAACSPGVGSTSNAEGGNGGDGEGASGATTGSFNFGGGGSTSSGVSNCTDPGCVGSSPQGNCDMGLTLDSADAMDGARAIGLCAVSDGTSWGVKSAEWTRSDGLPLSGLLNDGKGILGDFGTLTPREGNKLLVLSSGAARDPGDPGYQDPSGYQKDYDLFDPFASIHGAPPGFPKESPACPGVMSGDPYDSAALRLVIKSPTDAKSFSFNFNFYTYEYPGFICSTYNDFFLAMLTPKPADLVDGNVSFDPQGNNISVNAGFLDVCAPGTYGGKTFACSQGTAELSGTGFEPSAATGWLETKAPIDAPGSDITLHFMIFDVGDAVLDSTVLIDNFKFESDGTTTGTTPVPQ